MQSERLADYNVTYADGDFTTLERRILDRYRTQVSTIRANMTDCVVIVPMLGRGHLMDRLRTSLYTSTDDARILWAVTSGDFDVLNGLGDDDYIVGPPRERGDYADKINAGVEASDEPLIFTAAIDLLFDEGWLETCEKQLTDQIRVVGTNDLTNPRTATGIPQHTLVARDYVSRGLIDGRPGLLCEDWLHEYVDDELIGTARKRGAYAHAADAHVEHLHPMAGKAQWDATYLQMRRRMHTDRRLLRERERLWR